jgi:formylglycine-generating enzyme required for sulfatase activity
MRARTVVAVIVAVGAAACVPQGDFDGTEYRCEESPICAPGFTCVEGACIATPDEGAAGDSTSPDIPAGSGWMGCEPGQPACGADAQPVHMVTLGVFALDVTEVTVEAYDACVAAGACLPAADLGDAPGSRTPVRGVTYDDAVAFCRWRDNARLPTEAEWERAARGLDGRPFPWGDEAATCARATLSGCASAPTDVGSREGASPYGAVDLIGNVSEWVADYYDAAYYAASPAVSPGGPPPSGARVHRGGGYLDPPDGVAAWTRLSEDPLHREPDVGFRCAR